MGNDHESKQGFLTKFLIAAGFVTVSLHGLNKLSAAVSGLKISRHKAKTASLYSEYKWKYGTVRYLKSGHGAPLLLLHSFSSPAGLSEWEKNISILSKHYTVYALEFLGFGHSEKPLLSYSSYLYVSLVNDFIRDVVKDSVFVAASGGHRDLYRHKNNIMNLSFLCNTKLVERNLSSRLLSKKLKIKILYKTIIFASCAIWL